MSGSSNVSSIDFVGRLRGTLPQHWFGDDAPVLDGLLNGLAASWKWLFAALEYVRLQTRIRTATDLFLDLSAGDYFGARLPRRAKETDDQFRPRIQRELLRTRTTRSDLVSLIVELTGNNPTIFEAARAADTGAWGVAVGYGLAGAWGSLSRPFECLVTVQRPARPSPIGDPEIYSSVAAAMPVAVVAWTRIVD